MERLLKVLLSGIPWLIVAALLWAALFVKPRPVGASLKPPVLEQRDYYYGLSPMPDGKLLAVGSNGKILRIDPVSAQVERLTAPTMANLQDVATWDGGKAIVVGNGGVVLVSTGNDANPWKKIDGVPRSEIANKLTRVRTSSNGVAIAGGEMGALLLSRDFGATWSRLRDEEDLAWNDMAFVGDSRIVVVGEFGQILVSTDQGATWREPLEPVSSSLMSVAFRDASHGVAVGLEGVVLTTRDGGDTWAQVDVDADEHLFDVTWDAADQRWIVAGALGRWLTADGQAAQWTARRLDARDLSWHTGVLAHGGQIWFAGANVGRWDGQKWSVLGD